MKSNNELQTYTVQTKVHFKEEWNLFKQDRIVFGVLTEIHVFCVDVHMTNLSSSQLDNILECLSHEQATLVVEGEYLKPQIPPILCFK
jgi:hypothetical protein